LDLYSTSSLKQQSVDRHVAPLGHIILIPSQPVCVLRITMFIWCILILIQRIIVYLVYSDTYWTYHCLFGVFWYLLNVSLFIWWILILIDVSLFIWCILIFIECITMFIWCILILIERITVCLVYSDTYWTNSDTFNKYQNTPNKQWYVQ
jgi:hypothetical protein